MKWRPALALRAHHAVPVESDSGRIDSAVWRVLLVVFIGPFMAQLDSTVVNVSLSAIRDQLHATTAAAQWIVSGYLLALAIMLPLNAWLVDRMGAKRLYLFCFSLFTLASLSCGAARTMPALILARIVQGMAGGLMAPMAQMMVARTAGRHMARAMGYMIIPVLLAPILGPTVAGAILQHAGWPWLFYLNLPTGILGVGLAAWLLPGDEATVHKRPFDRLGFLLVSPGLASLLYGFSHAAAPQGQVALVAGAALTAGFVWHARRMGSAALLDLGLFRNPVFSTSALTQFLANATFFARQLIVPLFLIAGCGLPADHAGWIMAAMGVGMLCTYPVVGFATERFGYRAICVGGGVISLAGILAFLVMTRTGYSIPLALLGLVLMGAGQGGIGIPSVSAAYAAMPKEKLPLATTAINIVQRLGGPLATTLMGVALSLSTGATRVAESPGSYSLAFLLLVGVQLATIACAQRLPVRVEGPLRVEDNVSAAAEA
jgi:EmrB/QacA subfamily drug resistance transporter